MPDAAHPVVFALGLGANLGAPIDQLERALGALQAHLGPLRIASLFCTQPHSSIPQPHFFNTAASGFTRRSARDLLALGRRLEREAGRQPGPIHGPRPLDIDLLIYGDEQINQADLIVPHPRLAKRRFVLAPLAEIAPALVVPGLDRTVLQLLDEVGQEEEVERLSWPSLR